ncbi:MAG: metallophosphoesterase [Candidatus Thorarchaeota archaeon]
MDLLLISDIHVGRKTPSFNFQLLKRRWKEFTRRVSETSKEDLHIALLGDIIDGETVYPSQGTEIEMTVDEMIDQSICLLEDLFEKTDAKRVVCVYGNHGRSNFRGAERSNWDLVLYKRLRDRIGEKIEVSERWWHVTKIGRWRTLLFHGDNIRMYQQIPYYGVIQRAMRFITAGIKSDIICMGHFHSSYYLQFNRIHIFGNGTALKDDDYALRLGLSPSNEYWLIRLDEKKPIKSMELIPI